MFFKLQSAALVLHISITTVLANKDLYNGNGNNSNDNSLQCFFNANTTHLTQMPKIVSCQCADQNATNHLNIDTDIFFADRFDRELVRSIQLIKVDQCTKLNVDLSSSNRNSNDDLDQRQPFDIRISDVDQLNLTFGSRNNVKLISLTNVVQANLILPIQQPKVNGSTSASTKAKTTTTTAALSTEEIYFYIIIGLSSLLLISWVLILILVLCQCCRSRGSNSSDDSDGGGDLLSSSSSCCGGCRVQGRAGRKVKRAGSWRYEGNIYVNPTQRQQQQQQALQGNNSTANNHAILQQFQQQQQQQRRCQPSASPATSRRAMTAAAAATAASTQQKMLPYQLVPQREATMMEQQFQSCGIGGGRQQQQQPPGFAFAALGHILENDSFGSGEDEEEEEDGDLEEGDSFRRHDESEFDQGSPLPSRASRGDRNRWRGGEDRQSNANSASYGSRHQADTLPLPPC